MLRIMYSNIQSPCAVCVFVIGVFLRAFYSKSMHSIIKEPLTKPDYLINERDNCCRFSSTDIIECQSARVGALCFGSKGILTFLISVF